MTGTTLPLPSEEGGGRFPGFEVMDQVQHWDEATRAVVVDRVHGLPHVRFFTPAEEAVAHCLLDQLVGQRGALGDPHVDLVRMVDSRLAEDQTDGWHYDTMPPDEDAWRQSLAALDDDAVTIFDTTFARLEWEQQTRLLASIKNSSSNSWHDLDRSAVWSLWTRYAATAFYSHPAAWNEIGFSGPAYPRGYKNLGVDKLEPYEVHDGRQQDDPVAGRNAPERNS